MWAVNLPKFSGPKLPTVYSGFHSTKRLEVFLLVLDGMLVERRLPPGICRVVITLRQYTYVLLGPPVVQKKVKLILG